MDSGVTSLGRIGIDLIEITRERFVERVGREPEEDELERCNCKQIGEVGHFQCGWCELHDLPRFVCGCKGSVFGKLHDDIILDGIGVFEPVHDPRELQIYKFVVAPSSEHEEIPRFGVLPIMYDHSVTLLWEKGVPGELIQYFNDNRDGVLEDAMGEVLGQAMTSQTFNAIIEIVRRCLICLVCEGYLFRELKNRDRWSFCTPTEG